MPAVAGAAVESSHRLVADEHMRVDRSRELMRCASSG
jgi:hypothetical protein